MRRGYGRVRRGYVGYSMAMCKGAAWLCGRVRRGYVVSALGCCTAVPGSNPPWHPSLGSAQENPGAEKYRSRFFPAQQQAGVSARHQGCQEGHQNLFIITYLVIMQLRNYEFFCSMHKLFN